MVCTWEGKSSWVGALTPVRGALFDYWDDFTSIGGNGVRSIVWEDVAIGEVSE